MSKSENNTNSDQAQFLPVLVLYIEFLVSVDFRSNLNYQLLA